MVEEFCFVNDFLQISAFNPNDQLFSFYYYVNTALPYQLPTESVEIKPDGDSQNFRWIPLSQIDSNQFTFPIDKKVVSILKGGA